MLKTNYHTHSKWSDGMLNPESVIQEAVKQGFDILGFSDHSPVPFKSDWNMKFENLLLYINDIKKLKQKYEGKIKIFLGLEADFIDGTASIKDYEKFGFDYTIGGNHYLLDTFDDGTTFNIDKDNNIFQRGLTEIFKDDIKLFSKQYYLAVNQMVENDKPDVIAHLDLIEKFNKDFKYFDSKEQWYQKYVDETLDLIQKSGCIVELNSRSLYKGLLDDFNPKKTILEKVLKLNIPVTISGDVHKPEELSIFWEMSVKHLQQVGFKEMMFFDENGWQPQEI